MSRTNLRAAQTFDPYASDVTRDDLLAIRRQLAKVMNQRMVRLENTKSPITGEAYTFGSYEKMQDYLTKQGRTVTGNRPGGKRFAEQLNVDMSNKQLIKEIRALQGYSEQPSSTISGMHKIEAKRIKTFEDKGLDASVVKNKDFYDFLNNTTFDRISKIIDSDKVVEEYNRQAKQGLPVNEIVDAIDKYVQGRDRVSIKGLKISLSMRRVKWEKSGANDKENPFT